MLLGTRGRRGLTEGTGQDWRTSGNNRGAGRDFREGRFLHMFLQLSWQQSAVLQIRT